MNKYRLILVCLEVRLYIFGYRSGDLVLGRNDTFPLENKYLCKAYTCTKSTRTLVVVYKYFVVNS